MCVCENVVVHPFTEEQKKKQKKKSKRKKKEEDGNNTATTTKCLFHAYVNKLNKTNVSQCAYNLVSNLRGHKQVGPSHFLGPPQ